MRKSTRTWNTDEHLEETGGNAQFWFLTWQMNNGKESGKHFHLRQGRYVFTRPLACFSQQDYADYFTDFHKLGGRTGHGPRKSPWHFGVDPDKGAEHFFQQIIHGSCRIFGFHECVQFAADPNKKLDLVDFNLSFIRRLLVSYISQLNNGKESRKLFYYWLFYFSKHVYV